MTKSLTNITFKKGKQGQLPHLYRYVLCMCLLLVRIVLHELTRPRTDQLAGGGLESSETLTAPLTADTTKTIHITENKLCGIGGEHENCSEMNLATQAQTTFLTYKAEADNYALQHQVNKLKQHHRRAFELISRALQIDEETGSKDTRQG